MAMDAPSTVLLPTHRRRVLAFTTDVVVVAVVFALALVLDKMTGLSALGLALAAGAVWIYYVGVTSWLMDGQSAGKVIHGLQVARRSTGSGPRTLRGLLWAIGRHTVGYVVTDLFLVGALLTLVDRRRRCLHDYAFASEVRVATGDDVLAGSFGDRYRAYWERFSERYDELNERSRWFFFPWKWLSKALIVVALLLGKLVPATRESSSTAPAGSATTAGTKAAAGLWVTTTVASGIIAAGAWSAVADDEDPTSVETTARPPTTVASDPAQESAGSADEMVAACVRERGLSSDLEMDLDDPEGWVVRQCTWPPVPGADPDGYAEIAFSSRQGPGQSQAEGMTSAIEVSSTCEAVELGFVFMHQGPRTVVPPFVLRDGEVRRVEGGTIWEPVDEAEAEAFSPPPGEAIVLGNGRYSLETARCVE